MRSDLFISKTFIWRITEIDYDKLLFLDLVDVLNQEDIFIYIFEEHSCVYKIYFSDEALVWLKENNITTGAPGTDSLSFFSEKEAKAYVENLIKEFGFKMLNEQLELFV